LITKIDGDKKTASASGWLEADGVAVGGTPLGLIAEIAPLHSHLPGLLL